MYGPRKVPRLRGAARASRSSRATSTSASKKLIAAGVGLILLLVIVVLVSRSGNEDKRTYSVTIGGTVFTIPPPKGSRQVPQLPPAPPGTKIHLFFSLGSRELTNIRLLQLSELEAAASMKLEPGQFKELKTLIKAMLNVSGTEGLQEATNQAMDNTPGQHVKVEEYQIVEDSERVLTLELAGKVVKDGKMANMRSTESFRLINGRLLRLSGIVFVEPGDTLFDMKPQLDEWWQAILSANNAN